MMKIKKNITLIGMPAVGKSTVGNFLAKKIGFDFLDTDNLIQSKEQKTLSRIILEKGLDRFLQIEENHIVSIACLNSVIATGGSVVYSQKAMGHLCKISTIIYLSIDLAMLLTRLCDITSRGVAIRPEKSIEDLYKERSPLYDTYCDIKIDCSSMTAEQVVEKALQNLS
ncbi:shikimate kinase [Desulfobacula sp.]|uniref:shikimate kinase n=1 Tax=Desulfobacula sp. TaxID=2593537 RepID=UPI0025C2E881|nr:shikimate kinase [Desulfobacula sp.]